MLNGLSQGTVKSFMQDENGFIWVGTRNGLNRFDGYRFTVFKNIPGDSTSLINNHITDIKKSGEGKLWIATWGDGINLFDLKKQQFSRKLNNDFNLNNLFIYCLLEDTEGNLWIGTDEGGLYKYNTHNKKITRYLLNPAKKGSISDNTIRAIYEDHNKKIWIGTQNGGLNLYNSENDNFFNQNNPDQYKFPSAAHIRAISELNGELCLGTYGNGLILKNMKTGIERAFSHRANQLNSLSHDIK
jgi:ligand-binding sensor domain-containing protein